jgi:Xaa-Pro aminopeptidase
MPSFRTISASGSNGAIVHYGANETSKRILQGGELYLVDSGGHYQDGTTDITRTIYIANEANPKPKDIYIEDYTLVLKAHIAIAMAIFPKQSTGMQIDAIARNILWQYGRDYHHGTGHGIGYALSVHEGDVSISPRCHQPLQSGMLLSNEPGLYVEDSHGIRLENNVLVQKHPNYDGYLCFETISYIKFDDRLIAHSLLTKAEQKWLEQYHANCP